MDQAEFKDLIDEERFMPFMITTKNGFTVAIGPAQRAHILLGRLTLITMDGEGNFIHVPYHAIDRINQLQ